VRIIHNKILAESDETFAQGSSPSDRITPPSSPRMIKDRSEGGVVSDPVDLQLVIPNLSFSVIAIQRVFSPMI